MDAAREECRAGVSHGIYSGSTRFPDWAQGRREEIIGRIKTGFPEPDDEYDER
jgi:hypothetical protein